MKKLSFLFCFCFVGGFAGAQQLVSSVIASSGAQFKATAGSLDWTLGEIMSETYKQDGSFLTQGFQQPSVVRITSIIEANESLLVYPNPVRYRLFIKTGQTGDNLIEFSTLHGVKLISHSFTLSGKDDVTELDMKDYSAGFYLLRIIHKSTGITTSFKIEKY